MQPTTSTNHSRPSIPKLYPGGFGKSVIDGKGFIYLGISKMVLSLQELIRAVGKADIWLHAHHFR